MRKNSLWALVVRSKYKCGEIEVPIARKKKNVSNFWKRISSNWKNIENYIFWHIGDGEIIDTRL